MGALCSPLLTKESKGAEQEVFACNILGFQIVPKVGSSISGVQLSGLVNECPFKRVVMSLAWGTDSGRGGEVRINSFLFSRHFSHVEPSKLPTSWPKIVVLSSPFAQNAPGGLDSEGKAYGIQSSRARDSFARDPPSPT